MVTSSNRKHKSNISQLSFNMEHFCSRNELLKVLSFPQNPNDTIFKLKR
jgi:hypothetical protein